MSNDTTTAQQEPATAQEPTTAQSQDTKEPAQEPTTQEHHAAMNAICFASAQIIERIQGRLYVVADALDRINVITQHSDGDPLMGISEIKGVIVNAQKRLEMADNPPGGS